MKTNLRDFLNDEILWSSVLEAANQFLPATEKVANHPCDTFEDSNGLVIEVAAVGIDKESISITTHGETLQVSYKKPETKDEKNYFFRSIKRSSFSLVWKISNKYDLSKIDVTLDKGLLSMKIPFSSPKNSTKQEIKIK